MQLKDWRAGTDSGQAGCYDKYFLLFFQSVFRNYDHDHDGYISQEDFESIAANFPFLDSFCVLDKDQ